MLKNNRLMKITDILDEQEYLKVKEAALKLNVTEMTIRRDFKELANEGKLIRVHGGAKKKKDSERNYTELSHLEKKEMNILEKKYIAEQSAKLIKNNDILFIGPGTTTEYMYDYINVDSAKIVTNSISIFNRFKDNSKFETILIGGRLREKTGSFVGYFSRKWVEDIHVDKIFIGANGIKDGRVTTADEEEGFLQRIVLENAKEKYLLVDSSKFDVEAFQTVIEVDQLNAIITDQKLDESHQKYYKNKCKIIN